MPFQRMREQLGCRALPLWLSERSTDETGHAENLEGEELTESEELGVEHWGCFHSFIGTSIPAEEEEKIERIKKKLVRMNEMNGESRKCCQSGVKTTTR